MSAGAVFLTIGLILVTGAVGEWVASKLCVPRMLLLILAGVALGPSGLGWLDVPSGSMTTQRLLAVGVAIVLFHGGLQLSADVLAGVAVGLMMLATVGVVASAVIVGSAAAAIFHLPILSGLLVGAVLAPTDPAILIPIFDRLPVAPKVAQTIIAESALNDPAGALLTLVVAAMVVDPQPATHSLRAYVLAALVSVAAGVAVGAGVSRLVSPHRARIWPKAAPVLALAIIAGAIAVAALVTGSTGSSSYLGAFLAGFVFANAERLGLSMHEPYEWRFRRRVGAVTHVIVNVVFVLLGTSLPVTSVVRHWAPALVVVAALCLVARPLVVLLCLAPDRRARWTRREVIFIAATRETGVMPAALAFALVGMKFSHADLVMTTVVVALFVTVGVQATLKPWLASRLELFVFADEPAAACVSAGTVDTLRSLGPL